MGMPDPLAKHFYEKNILTRMKDAEDNISLLQKQGLSLADLNFFLQSETGVVKAYAGDTPPTGYLLCDGTSYLRTDYSDLFDVIGTTYGAADSTHFNVPNLKGKVIVGVNSAETEFDVLGETGGAKTHALTAAQNGTHTHVQNSHNHTQNSHNHTQDAHQHGTWNTNTYIQALAGATAGQSFSSAGGAVFINLQTGSTTATNQAATAVNQSATAVNQDSGSGTAHNNLQPYIALNYIIKT